LLLTLPSRDLTIAPGNHEAITGLRYLLLTLPSRDLPIAPGNHEAITGLRYDL
jgi:hypothetical protein